MSSHPLSRNPLPTDVVDGPVLGPDVAAPSEEDVHREHRAALEATLFRESFAGRDEVVLELECGLLRLRAEGR